MIGPDPDGAGARLRPAQRTTYDAAGRVTLAERGTVTGLTDPNWAAFVSLQKIAQAYDAWGRPTHQRLQSGSTTYALTQVSYDAAGRQDCVTQRMNPSTFASPPASACTAATTGAFGADRRSRFAYDAAGLLLSATSGYGVDPIVQSQTWTDNGQVLRQVDGEGNTSLYVYDGFDRVSRLRFPNAAGSGPSSSDYQAYTYDAAGNVTFFRSRGGQTTAITYTDRRP